MSRFLEAVRLLLVVGVGLTAAQFQAPFQAQFPAQLPFFGGTHLLSFDAGC